jgi:SAM-dependent methyltransferase
MPDVNLAAVDPSNREQLQAWSGDEGAYWAAHAEQLDRGMAAYDPALLEAAHLHRTACVLDIGCGTGATSRAAARVAADGTVLGIDLSPQMIRVGREQAAREGLANVEHVQGDAQVHPFGDAAWDVAISRAGVMFFGDQPAAFANIARALRPGGHLALLVWQELSRNEWLREIATALAAGRPLPSPPPQAPGPFSLSDPDRVGPLLATAGFTDVAFRGLSEPMHFGRTAEDAYAFVTGLLGWMLEGLDDVARGHALEALRSCLERHETGHGVLLGSAAWLITGTCR